LPDAELTLIANVALDRVDGGAWTGGGCPAFAARALALLGARGTIHTACADADRAAFAALAGDERLSVGFLTAAATTRFALDYDGESRSMVVHAIGHSWSAADVDRLDITTEWVHLAPLLRSDFPVATVARLAARGHRVGYDGQGLVRVPALGDLRLDARYDPELLEHLTVLKLSDEEAAILSGSEEALAAVPELVLTHGSQGAEVHAGGAVARVAPERVIADVQSTGAGDAFMVGYVVGRGRALAPAQAAALGAQVSSTMLAERRAA
jgi:sugar/nucleoside kinase (ribokinase family)